MIDHFLLLIDNVVTVIAVLMGSVDLQFWIIICCKVVAKNVTQSNQYSLTYHILFRTHVKKARRLDLTHNVLVLMIVVAARFDNDMGLTIVDCDDFGGCSGYFGLSIVVIKKWFGGRGR